VAARSAAPGAGRGREVAWFAQPDRPPLVAVARTPFATWYAL
jgi:hypothetical protein